LMCVHACTHVCIMSGGAAIACSCVCDTNTFTKHPATAVQVLTVVVSVRGT
jgi:hypothetical protein